MHISVLFADSLSSTTKQQIVHNTLVSRGSQSPSQTTPTETTMPRGNVNVTKVHYKGKDEDFIVFVDSADDLKAWKKDSSIPLAQVASSFKIMITHK